MENLLNYKSDDSSDDNSDNEVQINSKNSSVTSLNSINNNNNGNSNIKSISYTSNSKHENQKKKELSLVVAPKKQISITTTSNDYAYPKSSEYIQNQFLSLPPPKYQTTGYSNLNLNDSETPPDDESRQNQTKLNIQHALQEENKRKREALYQSYRTSAQLNSILDKPVRPYVSKRLKKTVPPSSNNLPQNLPQTAFTKDQLLNENSKKVLYINSSYLSKPSSDYLQTKKFSHIIPSHTTGQLYGHTKGVNVLRWKLDDGYLLASASMDCTACIWDVFHSKKPARIIPHQGVVKDIQWRNDNTHVLTASFDKTIKLFDVEAGKVVQTFTNEDMVNVLRFHPKDQDLFIAGLYKKGIVCWDVRSNSIVSSYKGFFGEVQDLEFLDEGKSFLAASDIIKRNSTDKAIVVWDFSKNVILSNQIYQEAYNCTAIRIHPKKKKFIAQSNAGYIAIFDTKPPWSLDKFKRFESHSVSGNRIQCNFSPDGRYVGSGSSDGRLYFYDWKSAKCIKRLNYGVHAGASCMDVAWCPQPQHDGYACVASCDNKGRIALWN